MINIEINYDFIIKPEDIKNLPEFPGLYVFLDEDSKPVYVGRSKQVRTRVWTHLRGGSNTSKICHFFKKVALIHEESNAKRMAAELFLINEFENLLNIRGKYRPHFNKMTEYSGRPLVHLCEGTTVLGQPCLHIGHLNGFCHLHGGNGIHKYDQEVVEKELSKL